MTRRLDPIDRVREVGDASVHSIFDVHALFFADDAVTIETTIQQAFFDRRINQVNTRREFVYAHPTDVLTLLQQEIGPVLELTDTPPRSPSSASRKLLPPPEQRAVRPPPTFHARVSLQGCYDTISPERAATTRGEQ